MAMLLRAWALLALMTAVAQAQMHACASVFTDAACTQAAPNTTETCLALNTCTRMEFAGATVNIQVRSEEL